MLATNILLVIVSALLFGATVMYAIAAWRMNKIVKRQSALLLLQFHLNAAYMQSPDPMVFQLEGHVRSIYERYGEYFFEILDTAFGFPELSGKIVRKAPRRLYAIVKWLCTGQEPHDRCSRLHTLLRCLRKDDEPKDAQCYQKSDASKTT